MKFPASAVTWIDGPKISMQEAGTVKKLLRSCLLLCLCAWLLPCALGEEWNGYPNGYVLCETLTLRESPDVTAPAMTTLPTANSPPSSRKRRAGIRLSPQSVIRKPA